MLERLMGLPKFGRGFAFHRLRAMGEGWFDQPLPALHVVGSSGKGSVTVLASAILQRLGLTVGTFTSPHLRAFNERIALNGSPIPDQALAEAAGWVLARREQYLAEYPEDQVSAFEGFFLAAMHYFRAQAPDVLVLEAGMGGRGDPTRIARGPVAALTSVALEHAAILGDTTEKIAFDKVDICPAGGELVLGRLEPELRRRLSAWLDLKDLRPTWIADAATIERIGWAADGTMSAALTIEGRHWPEVRFALPGTHQIDNAIVAYLAVKRWLARQPAFQAIPPEALDAAFAAAVAGVHWPGRLERVSDQPPFYIDVGHTAVAVATATRQLCHLLAGRPLVVIMGVSADKDHQGILGALAAHASVAICTRARHRGAPVAAVEAALAAVAPGLERHACDTVEAAVALARRIADERQMAIFAGGGMFLAIEAQEAFLGRDPGALRFY